MTLVFVFVGTITVVTCSMLHQQHSLVSMFFSGAIASWRALIGPTNSDKARADAPQSLRARFGTDGTQNACHGSDAPDTAAAELGFFFEQVRSPYPQ